MNEDEIIIAYLTGCMMYHWHMETNGWIELDPNALNEALGLAGFDDARRVAWDLPPRHLPRGLT